MACEQILNSDVQLSQEVELDESLFGRKVKNGRGEPKGTRLWVFGITERHTGRILAFPVADRSQEKLIPLIKKNVAPYTRIFTDGWSSYQCLNELPDMHYQHFVVNHSRCFTQKYTNMATGEEVTAHTNHMEGGRWLLKKHFKSALWSEGINIRISLVRGNILKVVQDKQHLPKLLGRLAQYTLPAQGTAVYCQASHL